LKNIATEDKEKLIIKPENVKQNKNIKKNLKMKIINRKEISNLKRTKGRLIFFLNQESPANLKPKNRFLKYF
jgi:hypothetical protein